jgi:hypothetical protein
MQGYVPAQDEAFAESRKCFGELEEWAASVWNDTEMRVAAPSG